MEMGNGFRECMVMISTPHNPYLYRFHGKIPALKNGKEISETTTGKLIFRSNKTVTEWYAKQPQWLASDIEMNKHLDILVRPFCVLELYAYASLYPLDTDNVYTTVQELIQPPDPRGREKGLLAIVSDDKYVEHHCVFTYDYNLDMPMMGAFLWVWESTEIHPVYQQSAWLMFRHKHLERYKKQTSWAQFDE
jgi:hypothetical protein